MDWAANMYVWSGVCFTKHLKPKIFVSSVQFVIYEAYEHLKLKMLSETESMLPYLQIILSPSFIFFTIFKFEENVISKAQSYCSLKKTQPKSYACILYFLKCWQKNIILILLCKCKAGQCIQI